MRVNVDSQVVTDSRFKRLGRALGIPWQEALGRAVLVWLESYSRRAETLSEEDIDIIAERDGFAQAMCRAELADLEPDCIRLRGVRSRIAFLLTQEERGKRGAAKRWGCEPSVVGGNDVVRERGSMPAVAEYDRSPATTTLGKHTDTQVADVITDAIPNDIADALANDIADGIAYSPDQDQSQSPDQDQRESTIATARAPVHARRPRLSLSVLSVSWVPDRDIETVALEDRRKAEGVDVGAALLSFRDDMRSRAKTSANWTAEWRKWIRREKPTLTPKTPSPARVSRGTDPPPKTLTRSPEEVDELSRMAAGVVAALNGGSIADDRPSRTPPRHWTDEDGDEE